MAKHAKHQYPKRASALERWLLRYQDAIAEEKLLRQRIDTLDAYSKATTKRITGMPICKSNGDVIPSLSDEREKLKHSATRAQAIKMDILLLLDTLPNDERRLLTAYYVEGLCWEDAAQFVPCSPRAAAYIKLRALKRLEAAFANMRIAAEV